MGNSKEDQLKIFFRIEKDLIHKGHWANLSSAAKSVYPVFGRHVNRKGETYVSQDTVAEEAGTSRQRVGRGVKDLAKKLPVRFSYSIRYQDIKMVAYSYMIVTPPPRHPATIRFYKEMIDEGHWKEMSKMAHAVYIAMRGLAGKEEEEKANWIKAVGDGVETYRVPYVKVKASKGEIAKAAGIDARWINSAFKELMHMLLVKPVEYDQEKLLPKGKEWVVYVVPVYSPAVKNEEIFEAHEDLNPIKYEREYGGTDDLERGHSESDKRHSKSKKRHSVTESSLTSSLTSSLNEVDSQEQKRLEGQESSPDVPEAPNSSDVELLSNEPCIKCLFGRPDRSGGMECCFAEGYEKHHCDEWKEWRKNPTKDCKPAMRPQISYPT